MIDRNTPAVCSIAARHGNVSGFFVHRVWLPRVGVATLVDVSSLDSPPAAMSAAAFHGGCVEWQYCQGALGG